MPEDMAQKTRLRVADLPKGRVHPFELRPGPEALEALARELDIRGLRKLIFAGALHPEGRRDWRLEAHLGATAVQDCVVTLAPVTTRIEEDVARRYLADPGPLPAGDEIEMPEDDTCEPLGDVIDLGAVLTEALALALPAYPRAQGAPAGDAAVAPEGAEPLRDDDLKPFAGLADLKRKLEGGG